MKGKIAQKLLFTAGVFLFAFVCRADPASGWKRTDPGTYNLSDPANWVDGNVNGIFGSDLELSGDQVLTVDSDLVFADGMNVRPGGTGMISFRSSGTRTLDVGLAGLIVASTKVEVTDGKLTIRGSIRDADGRQTPSVVVKSGAGTLETDAPLVASQDTLTVLNGTWIFDGAISGAGLTLSGGAEGAAAFIGKSSSNSLGAGLVLDGSGNEFLVEFQVAGAVSESAPISIRGTSVLRGCNAAGYPCSYFTTKGLIAADSNGHLGFGANYEPGDIDLRGCPDVILGSHGGNYSFGGKILVDEGRLLRLGGNKHLYLTGADMLTGRHDVLICNSAGATTYVQAPNDLIGRIVVDGSGFCLKDSNVTTFGSVTNADLEARNGSLLFFQATKGAGTTRLKSLTLKSSTLNVYASSSTDVDEMIDGDLVIDGECGGCSFVKFSTGAWATRLKARRLVMPIPAVLAVEGVGLGMTPGANACNLLFEEFPMLVGGGGAAGTTTVSIMPRVVAGATATGAEEGSVNDQSFATYESGCGVRPLDRTTEYATAVPSDASLVNLRIPFGSPLALTASARVNAVLFNGGANKTWVTEMLTAPEGCALTVESGQILCGQRVAPNAVYTSVPIDFGTATGTILYGSATTTCIYSPLSGSAGVVLGQVLTKAADGNKLMRFFTPPSWPLTGNVYVMSNCRLAANYIPNGDRTGDLYVMGGAVLRHPTMAINGLYGSGSVRPEGQAGASVLTIGSNGADGDFSGCFDDAANYGVVKTGTGVQRFSGSTLSFKELAVDQGLVKLDATVAADVTVADGAGLSVGAPMDGVTHEIVGNLTFGGDGFLTYGITNAGENARLSVRGNVNIQDGHRVVVAFTAKGKGGADLLTAQNVLSRSSFVRGVNCPRLVISEDGRTLAGSTPSGFVLIVR